MWFKGVLVLSYTALLVTPTNAAFQHKDEVLGRRESLTTRRLNRLNRRQQPWSNQTVVPEVPEPQESEPVISETPAPVVVVPTSNEVQSTSAVQDEATSADSPITTETPASSSFVTSSSDAIVTDTESSIPPTSTEAIAVGTDSDVPGEASTSTEATPLSAHSSVVPSLTEIFTTSTDSSTSPTSSDIKIVSTDSDVLSLSTEATVTSTGTIAPPTSTDISVPLTSTEDSSISTEPSSSRSSVEATATSTESSVPSSIVDSTAISSEPSIHSTGTEAFTTSAGSSSLSTSTEAIATDAESSVLPSSTEPALSEIVSNTELPLTTITPSFSGDGSSFKSTPTEATTSSKVRPSPELSSVVAETSASTSNVPASASSELPVASSVPSSSNVENKTSETPSFVSEPPAIESKTPTISSVPEPAASDAVTSIDSTPSQSTSIPDATSEASVSSSSKPVSLEPIETSTSHHVQSQHRQLPTTAEVTSVAITSSSARGSDFSMDTPVTPSAVDGTTAVATTPLVLESPIPSSIVAVMTTNTTVEEPTMSQTRLETSETINAGAPTTTLSEATSAIGIPESTEAASLSDLLPVSSIISDFEGATSQLASIVSSVKSNIGSIISSVHSGLKATPTEIGNDLTSSGIFTSVKPVEITISASETASDVLPTSSRPAVSITTGNGISLSGVPGTGTMPSVSPTPTDAPKPPTDAAEPKTSDVGTGGATAVVSGSASTSTELTSVEKSEVTTSVISSSTNVLPSFSIFDPSAVPTSASSASSGLASTEIPASETVVSPIPTDASFTSAVETSAFDTSLPVSETSMTDLSTTPSGTVNPTLGPSETLTSTGLATATSGVADPTTHGVTDTATPSLIPTSEAPTPNSGTPSGVSDTTLLPSSDQGVSMTSGTFVPTGFTTSASIAHPTDPSVSSDTETSAVQVDTVESQAPIGVPIPTSESTINTGVGSSVAEQSAIPSSTEVVATTTADSSKAPDGTAQASRDPSGTADPADEPTETPAVDTPAETTAQLGPPPTIPTGFDSDPAASASASSTAAPLGGAGGEEKPPPLSKSQTAGIAVGGTTCLLIALVAALFLARRYHSNMSNKRDSFGGDVYPEMAYIYDPPSGGNNNRDAEAGGGLPAMSGGAGGALSRSLSSASARGPAGSEPSAGAAAGGLARSTSKSSSYRHSIGPVYGVREQTTSPGPLPRESRYSTGSYLSTTPWDPSLALNAAAAASSISLNQYQDEASQNPFRDPEEPKPTATRPPMGGTVKGPLTINPYVFNSFNNNPAARDFPPMSPYGPANRSSSPTRGHASERHSDPFADPFEHDLILNVAPHASTDSSITVLAPPPTPRSAMQTRGPSPNPYEFRAPPPPFAKHFPGRDSDCDSLIPAPLNSGRNTPEGRCSPAPRESPDSQRTLVQPPSAHLGARPQENQDWVENRVNHPGDVPAPLFPKKPLPLRRQPTLAGPGQTLLASTGLPLTIKRKPMGNDSVSGVLDVPRNQHLSPVPTPTQGDFSDDPIVQRKRSGEMMFADPSLVGRQF